MEKGTRVRKCNKIIDNNKLFRNTHIFTYPLQLS